MKSFLLEEAELDKFQQLMEEVEEESLISSGESQSDVDCWVTSGAFPEHWGAFPSLERMSGSAELVGALWLAQMSW